MNEERLMVLKMVQDGKITPEQGESLLRALPPDPASDKNASASAPSNGSAGSAPHPGSYADLQGRLADVQVKLAELQSKLGAASSGAPPPSAGSRPFSFSFSEFNVGQMIDEAVRNVNSLKSESVKSFKLAARAAQKEGRRIRKEAKRTGRNFGIDLNFNFSESGRPKNVMLETERTFADELPLDVLAGREIKVINRIGDVKICSSTGTSPVVKYRRVAWHMDPDSLSRLESVRPEIVVDSNGKVQQIVVESLPGDIEHITLDIEIVIPDTIVTSIETTYGNVACEGRSSGPGHIETQTGEIRLLSIRGPSETEGTLVTRSGAITISHWDGPSLTAESISGNFFTDGLAGRFATVRSRSGEVAIANAQLSQELNVESSSGEIDVSVSTVGAAINAKTQSGDVCLKTVRAGDTKLESVSGDLSLEDVTSNGSSIVAETVSGDIAARYVFVESLSAVTISGDIDVTSGSTFESTLGARTISGDVLVKLTDEANAQVELTTQTGTIDTGVAMEDQVVNGSRFVSGRLGEGKGIISLQTVSGDVALRPTAAS